MILRSIILFILLTDALSVSAQVNGKFLGHLYKHGLKREAFRYISTSAGADSLNYFLADFAVKFQDDTLLEKLIIKQSQLCLDDSSLCQKISVRAFRLHDRTRALWFGDKNTDELKLVFLASENPLKFGENLRMNEYSAAFNSYRKTFKKNALFAAGLSSVIPGAGKLYLNKPVSFIGTFISTNLLIAQSAESVYRLGIKHPFSVFNIAAAGIFYLANVYGTYNDCRVLKKMAKQVFLNEATEFYNSAY